MISNGSMLVLIRLISLSQVRGPMILFQATLRMISKNGTFCLISSGAGTINKVMKPGQGAYGMSKAALNFMVCLTIPATVCYSRMSVG